MPDDCPPRLKSWIAWQLRQIADGLVAPAIISLHFATLNAPPSRITNGDVVFADGTNWNPGSGAGLYERRSGAWVKL